MRGNKEYSGVQSLIGFKYLFRGYIVKSWYELDSEETKYTVYNKMFVKECVRFYNDCWKSRCDLASVEKHVKDKLLLQVETIKRKYDSTTKPGVRSYIRRCPENMSVQRIENIQQWIRGYEEIKRNSPKYVAGDIRNFYSP